VAYTVADWHRDKSICSSYLLCAFVFFKKGNLRIYFSGMPIKCEVSLDTAEFHLRIRGCVSVRTPEATLKTHDGMADAISIAVGEIAFIGPSSNRDAGMRG
jgi:hypothetical protein